VALRYFVAVLLFGRCEGVTGPGEPTLSAWEEFLANPILLSCKGIGGPQLTASCPDRPGRVARVGPGPFSRDFRLDGRYWVSGLRR